MYYMERNSGIIAEIVLVSENIPKELAKELEDELIRCHSIMASHHNNGLIFKWNEEFDELYGKQDDYENNPVYEKFLIEHMMTTAKTMTEQNVSPVLTDFGVNKDFYLTAKLKGYPESSITFYMKEIS